jgi:magnesium-transporting ATPase (P-type)
MGSGAAAAKEVSSIVLTADDFEASLRAVMWGRNIYHNISRFIQFQVTVNISALVTIFVGIIIFNESPMTAVQLLWINLIMDTFAALALSTEPPLKQVIKGKPYKENVSILTLTVRGQIYLVSLWNILIMLILMFFGSMIAGLDYDRATTTTKLMPDGYCDGTGDCVKSSLDISYDKSQDKLHHFTYIYNTFVFLQLFNLINCRKIGRRDFNVFESFFHNLYFIGIFVLIALVQFVQINYFYGLTQTVPLQRSEWGSCIAVGSTTLLVSAIIKLLPDEFLEKLPFIQKGNEDEKMESN